MFLTNIRCDFALFAYLMFMLLIKTGKKLQKLKNIFKKPHKIAILLKLFKIITTKKDLRWQFKRLPMQAFLFT